MDVVAAAPGIYIGWGPFVIQLGNLIVITVMLVLFVLALVLPFPATKRQAATARQRIPVEPPAELKPRTSPTRDTGDEDEYFTWTGRLRGWLLRKLPPSELLPQEQPSYVASWIYVFGMGSLAALALVILSGLVLSLNGPSWYHTSALGHFTNSVHLWSVEMFFLLMVVHLWGKYWMAAWRGGRVLTWITGVAAFAVSIAAGFTGYLLQTNFDSQWIAFEGKDALNAVGIGAWFNVANVGQMFTWHIALLPLAIGVVVAFHVLLVRAHGVVPPIDASDADDQARRPRDTSDQLR